MCAVHKIPKLLPEVQPSEHLPEGQKKSIDFQWQNSATTLLGQDFEKCNLGFCKSLYLVRYKVLPAYLSALKFHTGTNVNPFSRTKRRRRSWLAQQLSYNPTFPAYFPMNLFQVHKGWNQKPSSPT